MIRSVSKTRTSFFPLDRTSETMVYTIAKLIQKKPVREGFVQQCAEKELWELLLSMLHHQLYDVKRKFADPRLAVTAQRNSTNIDAVDVVKDSKISTRIMKRGTGQILCILLRTKDSKSNNRPSISIRFRQESATRRSARKDVLIWIQMLLKLKLSVLDSSQLDHDTARVVEKILGHDGELERVNDIVTVHRKSVENDSKKRELSSAERKHCTLIVREYFFL